jgi:hypothetical protein
MAYWPWASDSESEFSEPIEIMTLSSKRLYANVSADTGLSFTRFSSWSPDGKYLYFSGASTNDSSRFDLYRYKIADSTFSRVTNGRGIVGSLAVAPDGESAVGYAFEGINGEQTSVLINLQTGAVQPLTACGNGFPSPIPRSNDFVCGIYGSSKYSIQRNDSTGSRVTLIDSVSGDPQATVSPNGSFVVYNKFNRDTRKNVIWLQSLDGSTPTKILSPQNGISINAGAMATNTEHVVISIVSPEWADEITVSNDGSFSNASTFPVDSTSITWDLGVYSGVTTRIVYVRFGSDLTYTDSIIVDTTAPVVSGFTKGSTTTASASFKPLSIAPQAVLGGVRKAKITASITEKGSGLAQVEYNSQANSEGSTLVAFSAPGSNRKINKSFTLKVPKNLKIGYFRVKDKAGNWSGWKKVKL